MPSALSVVFAVAGFLLGLAADRLATRWPEHDEEHPAGRRADWRTLVCAATGAVALGLLPDRFGADPLALVAFTAWVATLIVGLATDLDQRLLPDELTLPVVPLALLFTLSGANPLVGGDIVPAIAAAVIVPAVLYLPSIPFGAGAFGIGDVKLLVGVGLMLGLLRTFNGVVWGLLVSGIVLVVLLATRRIGRKSYVPFGPFLILGALWGLFLLPGAALAPALGSPAPVTVESPAAASPDPEDLALARHSLRDDLTDEVFYFVMPDRFENGDPANDDGGLTGDRLATGFDATDKGFYHGGDVAGLLDRLDYIENLGTTAIWMTPIFKNRPVQGSGVDASAGYHGYWITDFTQIDPHLGTNEELETFVDAAHARGIKVFFDIITNHTADVIDYDEGVYSYRNKADYPYVSASGTAFDDRDYAGTSTFPPLNLDSFPYSPVFRTAADETAKAPAWLNDPIYYHNRGDSTFAGEDSEYGDFFGLDDLFTEQPAVVDGLIDIFETWVTDIGIDGFRIDTAKHVNIELWQQFSAALKAHAASLGNHDFFMFGEVFDSNPAFMSRYTTEGRLQAVLDFGFQSRALDFAALSVGTDALRDFFALDDLYTDSDSNAYSLPTFLGNHDIGRIGRFVAQTNPEAEILARDELAHALMYLVRGMPVVYYGDEQGFTGDGGDKDARQDMMPSQVATYNDDDLIGTTATTADENFDLTHPLYKFLADLAALKADHPALRSGAQVHRYSTSDAGIYAFSRIDPEEGIEYVVALNNSETEQTQAIPTWSADATFSGLWPSGLAGGTTNGAGQLSVTVPPLSAVVFRADAALAADTSAPTITITSPAGGDEIRGRVPVTATLSAGEFAEVTVAVKVGDAPDWTVVGTDDNAPYAVHFDTAGLPPGTELQFKAVVLDASGNVDSETVSALVGEE